MLFSNSVIPISELKGHTFFHGSAKHVICRDIYYRHNDVYFVFMTDCSKVVKETQKEIFKQKICSKKINRNKKTTEQYIKFVVLILQ